MSLAVRRSGSLPPHWRGVCVREVPPKSAAREGRRNGLRGSRATLAERQALSRFSGGWGQISWLQPSGVQVKSAAASANSV